MHTFRRRHTHMGIKKAHKKGARRRRSDTAVSKAAGGGLNSKAARPRPPLQRWATAAPQRTALRHSHGVRGSAVPRSRFSAAARFCCGDLNKFQLDSSRCSSQRPLWRCRLFALPLCFTLPSPLACPASALYAWPQCPQARRWRKKAEARKRRRVPTSLGSPGRFFTSSPEGPTCHPPRAHRRSQPAPPSHCSPLHPRPFCTPAVQHQSKVGGEPHRGGYTR